SLDRFFLVYWILCLGSKGGGFDMSKLVFFFKKNWTANTPPPPLKNFTAFKKCTTWEKLESGLNQAFSSIHHNAIGFDPKAAKPRGGSVQNKPVYLQSNLAPD
ncbi:hypothetical protein, partial [Devosia indica]